MKSIPGMAKRIELWPLDRLLPYAANAREHSEEQINQIAASIIEFGFTNAILVDSADGIIAGHCRLAAARKVGLKEVPVVVLDHLSDAQRRAYILADNKLAEQGSWDEAALAAELQRLQEEVFDMGLIGFSDEELTALDVAVEEMSNIQLEEDEESIPEPPPNPVTQPGDLWILGEHRLLCGDSTKAEDVIRLMKGERAILFSTDPPYLVDYDGTNHPQGRDGKKGGKDWSDSYGKTWDDSSQGPELYEGFIQMAKEHAIESHAAWYCWHASKRQGMVESVWEKMGAFVHQQIIWRKSNTILSRTHYLWKHEPCFFGWIKGNRPLRLEDAEPTPTVWDMDTLMGEDRPEHPTPKPLDAFGIPMRQHVPRGGLCFEPFSGSGSQIMAGEENGRRVYAMKISPTYCDVAVQRFIKGTGKPVVLEGAGETFEKIAKMRGVVLDSTD